MGKGLEVAILIAAPAVGIAVWFVQEVQLR